MDLTVFTGAGRPLGMGILAMLAASLAGAALGALLPERALGRLREEAGGDRGFDPDGTLRGKTLVFQAAAMTGLPYGVVAAFFLAIRCGVFSQIGQVDVAGNAERLLTALLTLGAANLICGALKGVLAGRQLEVIAWQPEKFSVRYVRVLLPEVLQILALVYFLLTVMPLS